MTNGRHTTQNKVTSQRVTDGWSLKETPGGRMELQRHLPDAKEAQQRQAVGTRVRKELVQGVVAEEEHLLQSNGKARRCGTRTVNHSKVLPAQAVTPGQHRAGRGVHANAQPKHGKAWRFVLWWGGDCPHYRTTIERRFRHLCTRTIAVPLRTSDRWT